MGTRIWMIALVAALSVGCDAAVREVVEHAAVAPLSEPSLRPVPNAAVEVFVREFAVAVDQGDADAIAGFFDWKVLAGRSMAGLSVPVDQLGTYGDALERGGRTNGIVYNLLAVKRGEARMRHLGSEEVDGQVWQTFRMLMTEGGFDHLRVLLTADAQGHARVADFQSLTQGERASTTIRRVLLPLVGSDSESVMGRLTGKDKAYVDNIGKVKEALSLTHESKWVEALAALDSLPAELKQEQWVQVHRVQIAGMIDDATYQAAIEQLQRSHPNHPSTAVHLIDGHLLAGRYDAALAAVDTIQARGIDDPHLEVTRAGILMDAGRLEGAGQALDRALAKEPDLEEAHWTRVSLALVRGDFTGVTDGLVRIQQLFGYAIHLDGVPEYAEYIKSPEYGRLKAALAK